MNIRNAIKCAAIACFAACGASYAAPEQETAPGDAASEAMHQSAPLEGVQTALTKADAEAWLDGFMPYALKQGDIAGAVVTIVKDGEILASKGYGYADLETRAPVNPSQTMFRIGSVSKLFTWTAVMQLAEQGKIDLDRDVNAYLDFEIPEAHGAPITMRHLMTHTAGFEERAKHLWAKDLDTLLSMEEFLKTASPARIFPPGETPSYSNYGTGLAGYIVQQVAGMDFEDYVEAHIIEPLQMTHSTFRQPAPDHLAGFISKGYMLASDGDPKAFELVSPTAAGSFSASGDDMGRFMIAHLNNDGSILKPETAHMMHTTYDVKTPPLNAMALGFYQENIGGVRIVGHGGDTVLFHSNLSLFIDHNVGLFVSLNSFGAPGAASKLRTELRKEFAYRYFPAQLPTDEPTLDTAAAHGEMVAGIYETTRRSETNFLTAGQYLTPLKLSVTEEGELLLERLGFSIRWREVAPFVWRQVDGDQRLTAEVVDGKVKRIAFETSSPYSNYTPTPWFRSAATIEPFLNASLVILALTFLAWPARAIIRTRYGARFALSGNRAMGYRLVRIGAAATLAYLAIWSFLFIQISGGLTMLTASFDIVLRAAQASVILPAAALAAALWNAALNWTERPSWFAMAWSALLPLAVAACLWHAAAAGYMNLSLNY